MWPGQLSGALTMSKQKIVKSLSILGLLDSQCNFISKAQSIPENQLKKNLTIKFEFPQLPYPYDA